MHMKQGEWIDVEGCTIVEGVSVPVLLRINTVQLIHALGGKAAASRGRRAQIGRGLIVASTGKDESYKVREIKAAKRNKWRHPSGAMLATRGG